MLYHYAPSRGAEVAKGMLGDFKGYLQTDGYEVYDRVCESAKNVIHAPAGPMHGASSSRRRRTRPRQVARRWPVSDRQAL